MAKGTCEVDGCEKAAQARGWCGFHHRRWLAGDLHKPRLRRERNTPPPPCSVEGCDKGVGDNGRGLCEKHYARWSRHGDARGVQHECGMCGTMFWGNARRTGNVVYCSKKCCGRAGMRAFKQRERPMCSIPDCGRESETRGWCAAHYARWKRYGDTRGQARTCNVCGATFYGGTGGRVTCRSLACITEQQQRAACRVFDPAVRLAIFERDGYRCHLCGGNVSKDLRWPHRLSATVDHVIPVSLGGTHEHTNLRCAHAHCNISKSNRAVNEQLLMH